MLTHVHESLVWLFGGDFPRDPLQLHQVAARAVVVYLLGLLIVRLGKSRLISRASALDVILGFVLGSLLSRGITGHSSISGTAVSSVVVVAMHWVLTAIAARKHSFGDLIKGHARPLIVDGKVDHHRLLVSHLSDHDLLEAARLHGLGSLDEVQDAYKERSGDISVIKRKGPPQVVNVAVQDGVQTVRIEFG